MDDLSRLFDDCQDFPDGPQYGSPAWQAAQDARDDIMAEALSEDDLALLDAPDWDELAWWSEVTRTEPTAAELALATAEIRQDAERANGWLAVLDEGDSMRWYRDNVKEF